MTAPTFRPATAADLPAIVELFVDDALGRTRERPGMLLDRRYVTAFAAIEVDANQLLVVVEDGDKVIGCLQLRFIPALSRLGLWRGQIESVRIAEGRRGGGLGLVMLEWAIERCRERGCGLVQLTTDKSRPEALRFYERLGFRLSREGLELDVPPKP